MGRTCGQDSVCAVCNHVTINYNCICNSRAGIDGKQPINSQLILKHSKHTLHECNCVGTHSTIATKTLIYPVTYTMLIFSCYPANQFVSVESRAP